MIDDSKTPKEKIAQWFTSIAKASEKLAHQITDHTTDSRDLESQLLYLKLIRHSTLLRDASNLITKNSEQRLANTFVLLRCMLEDFIVIYYLRVNAYNSELIVSYFAEGIFKRLKLIEETASLNERFYKSKLDGFVDFEYLKKVKNDLILNPENDKMFVDKKKFKLKRFLSPTKIIEQLPVNESSLANVPSILHWMQYSEYVHHSAVAARGSADNKVNTVLIQQLKAPVLYAYKLVEFIMERLIERRFPIESDLDSSLRDELTKGSFHSGNLWDDIHA